MSVAMLAHLAPATADFYRSAMRSLNDAGAPYLVGGAYAFARYTGIERHTKDFDIFCRRGDAELVLEILAAQGCRTERTFPHWLAKAYSADGEFVDVIYSSGSGIAVVDDLWFARAEPGTVLGVEVRLCPAEEMIWSKGYILERERFDGADIAHLIRARGSALDWPHLVARFGRHWRVLLGHLVLFGFVYPGARHVIPPEVLYGLVERLRQETGTAPSPDEGALCQGTLVSREQYLVDIGRGGYRDARLEDAAVNMTPADIAHWTRAIEGEAGHHGELGTQGRDAAARRRG